MMPRNSVLYFDKDGRLRFTIVGVGGVFTYWNTVSDAIAARKQPLNSIYTMSELHLDKPSRRHPNRSQDDCKTCATC